MISIDEIDKTILDLEQHDTSYATCEKLAWLYIVRDHLQGVTTSNRAVLLNSKSDFLKACEDVPIDVILYILDEHMDAINAIYPKEYRAIIARLIDNK